jgi:hypothetical protein
MPSGIGIASRAGTRTTLGEAAIDMDAELDHLRAVQDLVAPAIEAAPAADGVVHHHPVAGLQLGHGGPGALDGPDDLVAGDQRQPVRRVVAVENVQIGAANPAARDADDHVVRPRLRLGNVAHLDALRREQDRGAHQWAA